MATAFGADLRRARLEALAAEFSVFNPAPVIVSPPVAPTRTAGDDFNAEELLKRRRAAENSNRNSKWGFGSSGKKTWDPKEIFDALDAHVSAAGSPGVADALIAKLVLAGGDVNVSNQKTKTNPLIRRKSMEPMERSRILQKAIQNRQAEMVAVLVKHADSLTIDTALPVALDKKDPVMVQMLLQRGANTLQTHDGKGAFRDLCISGGHADLVGLILQSGGRPTSTWMSMALVDATRVGCYHTVVRLSRSTADGEYNNAEALKAAISLGRMDLVLAILTGAQPPTPGGRGLAESFDHLFQQMGIHPTQKATLTEALLCAGTTGDAVSRALSLACDSEYYDMVELLVRYGASLDFEDANIVRRVVSRAQTGLARLLLGERTTGFSHIYASECVGLLPKVIPLEDRYAILSLLLRKGAGGITLHEALIDAAAACDLVSVELLINPRFPDAIPVANGQRGQAVAYDRHEVADVNYKNGPALAIAVQTNNLQMLNLLLSGNPSPTTLDCVFPQVNILPSADRYRMTELFLAAGLTGACISTTLQEAIEEQPPRRDEQFISLLVQHSSNMNFDGGTGVLSAVVIRDVGLLKSLLQKPQTHETLSAAIAKAMVIDDKRTRYHILQLLINARGAGQEGSDISAALVEVLLTKPVDVPLAALLLDQGHADVNFDNATAVNIALNDADPTVFDLVIHRGSPNAVTLANVLYAICDLPTTQQKTVKAEIVLRRRLSNATLDEALVFEVQTVLKAPQARRNLAVIKLLLSVGASINNEPKSVALCLAVKAADPLILDVLFGAGPTAASLGSALPLSVNIVDAMDRLSFTRKLIDAGAPDEEVNRALNYAIDAHPHDQPLIGLLACHAASTDGEALRRAVEGEHPTLVALLLEKATMKYSAAVLKEAFTLATKVQTPEKRVAICEILLKQGVSGPPVSDALLAAAAAGDVELGALLIDFGASVEHNNGQAIIEASAAGAPEVLRMLLATKAEVSNRTLENGFKAAWRIDDLKTREAVFRLLLQNGVVGELLDTELISAAKFGEDGEDLVKLLLEFGADVDYNSGEAIWNTARSAMMGSLKLMLGIGNDRQAKPSTATLLRALKASRSLGRDARYQVIEWLFEAGLPASEEINIALNRAVKDGPDLRLIRLLLKHGASPLANACQTLIDTAQLLLPNVLAVLLKVEIPQQDISWTFEQAFSPDSTRTWLSEKGLQNAKLLLQKGATGRSLSLALSIAIDALGTENDAIAVQFANLILQHKPDVSYNDGLVVQKAARRADSQLIELVLQQKPDSRAVSMAFPYLFDSDLPEEDIIRLVGLFTDYHDGEERLDVMFAHPESEPVVFRALSKFPRCLQLLEMLVNAGYYHDQQTKMRIMEEIDEDEPATLLLWALAQPQKRISSSVINFLIKKKANVNYEMPHSKTTPLMLAIQAKRTDLVEVLVSSGADVNIVDATGNTPMTMATKIGGDIGSAIMAMILRADPSIDDGSLHNAARELNLNALEVLLQYGHDLDFPSPLHDGRSALGEVCLNAAHAGPLTAAQEKLLEKVVTLLIKQGTDLTIQAHGKSALLLALHSKDPIPTTRALLKIGMWKLINRPFNQYFDGTYTYSPTQYVARVLPESDHRDQLLELLKANRAIDVYYANDGPQPEGAVNLPEELLRAERDRRAREERISRDTEEHNITLARSQEIAQIQNQIYKTRAQLEDSRTRRLRDEDLNNLRERQAIESQGFAEEIQRRQIERDASLRHEQKLLEAGLSRSRLIAEADMERESRKNELQIEWENKRTFQAIANAEKLSRIRVSEREAIDRLENLADQRTVNRIAEHKRLVDSQNVLASQLANAGGNPRRQIGYVEELNP
ncbi:hypothetical protein B0T16DRAFT_354765 [Cercophora newfieldiana]|uniref:Uncharacterized protein n=1 Tax=Cercophora newfieldiana TaxID=92897 RepID=A0AA40CLU8_9PEZI|nr:hypothetical protein B0T16DRAFT_354765 [Cercophora newfieldiana]